MAEQCKNFSDPSPSRACVVPVFYKYSVIKILRTSFLLNQKTENIERLAHEREVLEEEKMNLEKQDPKTIEKKARELGLAKEGETIIRIKKANENEEDN